MEKQLYITPETNFLHNEPGENLMEGDGIVLASYDSADGEGLAKPVTIDFDEFEGFAGTDESDNGMWNYEAWNAE